MAKEGASYLAEILATRENLPPEDRSRLERALDILRDETQEMSTDEGAELIREKFGADLGDEVVLWDLMRDPVEKLRHEDRWGKIKTQKIDRRTDRYEEFEEFRGFVDTLPRNVRTMLTKSILPFAVGARRDTWDLTGSRMDTVGRARGIKIEHITHIDHMGEKSAQFLKAVFAPREPK